MDITAWLTAFAPILTLLVLLLFLRWGGDEAAVASLLVALLGGAFVFGAAADHLAVAAAKGMWTSVSIIYVIFPALLIYELSAAAGAFSVIRRGMQSFTPDAVLQVIAIGWIFADFLQGITGFGVPVVVCAPLLIGMGVKPVTAVVISLFGQAWGNTFGTLGLAWDGLAGQAAFAAGEEEATLLWSSNLLVFLNVATGFSIVYLAGGMKGLVRNVPLVFILSVLQGIGQTAVALFSPMLSNFIVATVSMGLIFFIGKLPMYRAPQPLHDAEEVKETAEDASGGAQSGMTLGGAFLPYIILVILAVGILMNDAAKEALGALKFSLAFPEKVTAAGFVAKGSDAYAPLTVLLHSGTFLLTSAVIGYLRYVQKGYLKSSAMSGIVSKALQKTLPAGIAVIGLIAMSKVMDDTGQTMVLARGAADLAASGYPLLSPFIGLLGTFMTGSNLSSNILFAGFQQQVAGMLGISKVQLLAAQTAGGATGSILSPAKVLLGTTAAGVLGSEGLVLRKVMPLALGVSAVYGVIVYLSYAMGG
ncbi:L-lactate permease [Selenomonas sp. TAMA-11512]|uniref:L-lactate permease n=1 Tax=Selenomonas sp. TAMA-11512 TaxID=3095337 RepID=UPI0030877CCF|nr:L-lactate permease [Selenomonas sp. TAMA-11512]